MVLPPSLPDADVYRDPFVVLDPRFRACCPGNERLRRLWTGASWSEGPAWFPAHQTLVWSDIPNNRMLRFDALNGTVGIFRQPSGFSNGNTVDAEGRLVTCEHGGRRVVRLEHNGELTVIADRWQGKRLNSPNDVVVAPDGAVWFTDPPYGILSDYEGYRAESEIGACHVYRVDPVTAQVECMADDFVKPNGLAFAPNGQSLFVVDTGRSHDPDGPAHIRAVTLRDGGRRLGASRVFADCPAGLFDGIRFDRDGRLWASSAEGVQVYDPDGTRIGWIRVPEVVSNLCFGGPRGNRLFMTGTTSLYSCQVLVNGA